jgi:hypothetical protein
VSSLFDWIFVAESRFLSLGGHFLSFAARSVGFGGSDLTPDDADASTHIG